MTRIRHTLLCICLLSVTCSPLFADHTWEQIQKSKKGSVTIHYRINEPFLILDKNRTLNGLEYEMIVGFKYYLLNRYGIQLDLNWQERSNFQDVYQYIKNQAAPSDIGLDIISRTPKREQEVTFSEPYFPDIQVMITKRNSPVVSSKEEFKEAFEDYTAVSTRGTTYDINLQRIRKELDMDFDFHYLQNSRDIISTIIKEDEAFGYTDLPNYLLALDHELPVIRQNLYPVKGIGYCLIFNNNSDWVIPINEYLESPEFHLIQEKGIQKYLGFDVINLISSITSGENEELVLLKQEKKFINEVLAHKANQVKVQSMVRNVLIVTIILAFVVAYFLFNRNRIKTTANEVLTLHRKMIESQNKLLSKRNEELIELNEEKNNFIQILSHDLRAPINNINGLSKILLMDGEEKLNEEQLRIIDHISAESRRLNKMVTRILDIERIESNSVEDFRPIDVQKVLSKVVGNYEQQAKSKEIAMNTELEENTFIMGLEQFLFHVFENLLSNALKFSPIGKMVFIKSKKTGEYIEISVEDQGPGMSEEDRQNMFKKFQVLTAKATGGERSTGLGLSIVQKYVNLLDGELECESELDHGTTFTVKFRTVEEPVG